MEADDNIAIGRIAGVAISGAGSCNIAIGSMSGCSITTGCDNIVFGKSAGDEITTGKFKDT